MNSAFQWLSDLIRWLGKLVPRIIIVLTTHAGVKWVRGKYPKLLEPGLHFYWPIVTEVTVYPQVRQTANLPCQLLMTSDSKTVMVGGIVVYDVKDMLRALTKTYELDETIRDLSLVAIKKVVISRTLDELRTQQESIDEALTRTLSDQLARQFGIRVIAFYLSDFTVCRCFGLVSVGGSPEAGSLSAGYN